MTNPESGEQRVARTTISLPVDLENFARTRGRNFSRYVADLIEEDRRRVMVWERLAEHGYVGDKAPTDAGRARARAVIERHRARKTGEDPGRQAA